MDCSWVAEGNEQVYDEEAFESSNSEEANALGKGGCYRCGGHGHIARGCSTPEGKPKGKGKTKGKGSNKGWSEGKGGKASGGKSGIICSHCHKPGHTPDRRFALHPELRRKSSAYHFDEEAAEAFASGPVPPKTVKMLVRPLPTARMQPRARVPHPAKGAAPTASHE